MIFMDRDNRAQRGEERGQGADATNVPCPSSRSHNRFVQIGIFTATVHLRCSHDMPVLIFIVSDFMWQDRLS
jgi:hypothetical protein